MKRVLIVGSGKRVKESALPAFLRARDRFRIAGVFSRTARRITAAGEPAESFEVAPLEQLDAATLAGADLIYMVVAKDAVPAVLRRIVAHDVSGVDMLIETPVLRFRLLGHLGLLDAFRNTWVSEDCTRLPFFNAVANFLARGAMGPPEQIVLEHSAYAYHGIAIGRALFGANQVTGGRRVREAGGARRTVRFDGGGQLEVVEPRDYARGHVLIEGPGGAISDDPASAAPHRLTPVVEGGACTGFRVDDATAALTTDERALMGAPLAGAPPESVTTWMDGMKRVGFLRLLGDVDEGRGAHPLLRAVEDTVVDYHLEKFGRYVATPLTNPASPLARLALRAVTRLAGG